MDCYEPVDDFVDAWPADYLPIPKINPSTKNNSDHYFFIELEVEFKYPSTDHDKDDDEDIIILGHVRTVLTTLWAPCRRTERDKFPKDNILGMLSSAGVPKHKQEYMVCRISGRANEIAHNKGDQSVVPMKVFISIITCSCYGESVEDPEPMMS